MGFEPFPVQSPFHHISVIVGPLYLSRTRTSHPPKLFPSQQPYCVTTSISFPPLHWLYCFQSASARPQGFAPLCSPLSWRAISAGHGPDAPLGFVPLQGSPLILECSREVLRSFSAEADLLWTQSLARLHPGLAFTEVNAELERSCSSQRLCSGCRLPRHGMCRNTAPCRPADQCQPALESFERPLLRFLLSICQLRRSPASRLHALQRSFRYEVALISRVFSAQDRSPLTSCQAAICRI